MSRKNDLKEFLKSQRQPTKAQAIELCGEEFVKELTAQKIFAKDELFWEKVCEKLNVPEYQKQRQLRTEQEEREKERLLKNLKLFEKRERKGWSVLIYEFPDSDILGKKYTATAQKGDEIINHLDPYYWQSTANQAFGRICSPIDSREDRIKRAIKAEEKYLILKSFYLMLLYLSSEDYYAVIHREDAKNKENFVGRFSWINLDFDVLNALERDDFISSQWTSRNSALLTKKGILAAIKILRKLALEEPEQSLLNSKLQDLSYHQDYAKYKNEYDFAHDGTTNNAEIHE